MATLDTVSDYVTQARILLQDQVGSPFRYPDADLLQALNLAMLEARRLRPDLFLDASFVPPNFSAIDATAVEIDQQYRLPFVNYVVGYVQLRDQEDTQDSRALEFISAFHAALGVAGG